MAPLYIYTLCLPQLSGPNATVVNDLRRKPQERFSPKLPVHITCAFASTGVSEPQYLAQVKAVAAKTKIITFKCRKTVLNTNAAGTKAQVVLVPDAGYAELSQLHKQLCQGVLAPSQRVTYIPYILIARAQNLADAKLVCDGINSKTFKVVGTIEALSVCSVGSNRLNIIASFPLQ